MSSDRLINAPDNIGVAIIGMAGRFPGANNLEEFWNNLCNGVESVAWFTDDELRQRGITANELRDPNYVKAAPILTGTDLFDAAYFGISPKEAAYTDPQHRVLLECAVESLENAGCNPHTYAGNIGVFVGASPNTYQLSLLLDSLDTSAIADIRHLVNELESDTMFRLGNDTDYLATRLSYKLNLRGPSIVVQTACSTSLVAVHLACQSLLLGECELALAGGVSITSRSYRKVGYHWVEGSMLSPDGHCRPFDAAATGTVFGDGFGMVVLKRLDRALADGDTVRAVIRGSAINNDGSMKVGYAGPGAEGQAAVVAEALAVAGAPADSISYVEAHGTATVLGDPIEVASLTKAFRLSTAKKNFCALGSVKSNIGHLNIAAGMASLMKVVLSLEHEFLPPTINFKQPNPRIDFADTPFFVNSKLARWPRGYKPRRAGLNSFGMGGTNAHAVIEEAPSRVARESPRRWHVLPLSARTLTALETTADRLAGALRAGSTPDIADIAHTLGTGRTVHRYRRAIVCHDIAGGLRSLEAREKSRLMSGEDVAAGGVFFMFPGQGSQRLGMGRGLYESEAVFRDAIDTCADLLRDRLAQDLRQLLFSHDVDDADRGDQLSETEFAQPAIFSVSYALAQLWMSWGVRPKGMIGHSVGELVAACLAGVLDLDDALTAVAERGRLMQSLPRGSMFAVAAAASQVEKLLGPEVSIAALNTPNACVVSGPADAIAELERRFQREHIHGVRLRTSHAFHSPMMTPAVGPLVEVLKGMELKAPAIPFVSNTTGTWIGAREAMDPEYWGRHLCASVRFSDGMGAILGERAGVLLEIGPGRTLTALAQENISGTSTPIVLASLPLADGSPVEAETVARALAQLWAHGIAIDWQGVYRGEARCKVPLPTYPFERQRYWLDASSLGRPRPISNDAAGEMRAAPGKTIDDAFYVPSWSHAPCLTGSGRGTEPQGRRFLVFAGEGPLSMALVETLRQRNADLVVVRVSDQFERRGDCEFALSPSSSEHFHRLLAEVGARAQDIDVAIYCWGLLSETRRSDEASWGLDRVYHGLIHLIQALAARTQQRPLELAALVADTQDIIGDEPVLPIGAAALGPCLSAPIELPQIGCRYVDLSSAELTGPRVDALVHRLIDDLSRPASAPVVGYRRGRAWIPTLSPVILHRGHGEFPALRENGVYLITGGLGAIGLALAEYLVERLQARVVLVSRSPPLPDPLGQGLDGKARRINSAISALKKRDAQVLVLAADVSDKQRMSEVIRQVKQRFGTINGVFHAAGAVSASSITLKTREGSAPIFASKIEGTRVLEELFREGELDILVLFSSISSVMGLVGLADYSAANAYLDAFARRAGKSVAKKVISINWDAWNAIGMAASADTLDEGETAWKQLAMRGVGTKDRIEPHEGLAALFRILGSDVRQIVVSKRLDRGANGPKSPMEIVAQTTYEARPASTSSSQLYARPELRSAYESPNSEIEKFVANLWATMLNLDKVGINDDFFELGGHSLLALRMIPHLRGHFKVEIGPRDLFEAVNVRAVAELIERKLITEIERLEVSASSAV